MVVVVGLNKGKITFTSDAKKWKAFDPKDVEGIGEYLIRPELRDKHLTYSSSCDFPHEYGFRRSFRIATVMANARDYAFDKLAIPVEPARSGKLADAIKAIDKAVKKSKHGFPLSLRFVRSGKRKKDVVFIFRDENEIELFVCGIKYAHNVQELAEG